MELILGLSIVLVILFVLSVVVADYFSRSVSTGIEDGVIMFIPLVLVVNWLMSLTRWFMTEHLSFWFGFKALIWALLPVINIFYVWDWWAFVAFMIGSSILNEIGL